MFLALALSACATANDQRTAEDLARDVDAAADAVIGKMSPSDRATFEEQVAIRVVAEMQAVAQRCGTSLIFSAEPRFQDRKVWVAPASSDQQIACVRKSYPFVEEHAPR